MAVEEKVSVVCFLKNTNENETHKKIFPVHLSINAHTNWMISGEKLPDWWSELILNMWQSTFSSLWDLNASLGFQTLSLCCFVYHTDTGVPTQIKP